MNPEPAHNALPNGERPVASGGRRPRDIAFFLLRIGLAVGIVGWLAQKHEHELTTALGNIRPSWLIVAVLLYAGQVLAGAWRWQLLLRVQNLRLSYRDALSLTMQGIFFSLVLPSAIGGDVVKAGLLATRVPQGTRLTGVFTILVDRIMGMLALFAVAGVIGICSINFLRQLEGYLELTVQALLCGCAGGLAAALGLYFHRQLERLPIIAALLAGSDRLTRGAITRFATALDAFRAAWLTLLVTFLIGIVCIHLPVGMVVWCLARGCGAESAELLLVILATALGNTVGAIPATPAGVGTRDLVLKNLLTAGGIAVGPALATTMLYTSLILGFNLLGGLFFVLAKKTRR